jgi:hypothetical protein
MIISEGQLRGQLAMWVARQSPYRSVAGVDEVGALITLATKAADWFGPDNCRMRRFAGWHELEAWCRAAIGDHPQLEAWNTPRNGAAGPVFTSRYDSPSPDDDFIDIDALFRNVALHSWRESEAEAAANVRIDAELATKS